MAVFLTVSSRLKNITILFIWLWLCSCLYLYIHTYMYVCAFTHSNVDTQTKIIHQSANIYWLWVVRLRAGWVCLFVCFAFLKFTLMLFCFYSDRALLLTHFWHCSVKMEDKHHHSLNTGKYVLASFLSVWCLNSSHVVSDPYCKLARMFPSRK